jgi:hypothetical protein
MITVLESLLALVLKPNDLFGKKSETPMNFVFAWPPYPLFPKVLPFKAE